MDSFEYNVDNTFVDNFKDNFVDNEGQFVDNMWKVSQTILLTILVIFLESLL